MLLQFCFRVTLPLALYSQSVRLDAEPLEAHGQNLFSQINTYGHSPYITFSLRKGWVWHIQLLLVLASTFIIGSEATPDHILLSHISDFPFCRLLRLAGRYSTPPPHGNSILHEFCSWLYTSVWPYSRHRLHGFYSTVSIEIHFSTIPTTSRGNLFTFLLVAVGAVFL
jgi:hypothetical protein